MITTIRNTLEAEYHNLDMWYFVSFISGIMVYFTLTFEPQLPYIILLCISALIIVIASRKELLRQFIFGLLLAFSFGLLAGKVRVLNLNTETIDKPIISQVEGIVYSIKPTTRGFSVLLCQVQVKKTHQKLQKIRVSIPAKHLDSLSINDKITLLAKLFRPQKSIVPSGYDFGFYAYLSGIGATGYGMSPPIILTHNNNITNGLLYRIRKNIHDHLITNMGATKGNFAAAILLGETKGIDQELMKNMRQSGISHILCVSGLHLSLVAMILFITTRFLLNLSNYLAYNYNIKALSATLALFGSYCYLELSGMQIAATRAFIMAAIFICAIIIERSCYPLRSLAIAAFIILSFNPEYIFHPSFQLSFIAVLSLIAGYEFYLKHKWVLGNSKGIFASIKFYIVSNIYSSFLASIVTAPVVINQFYTFATYSIPMNLVVVPIMSFFLMPLSIAALFFMIVGLDKYILKCMGFFIEIIIKCAQYTNGLANSVWYFGYITPLSIIIFLLGFFWICLWRTNIRFFGLVLISISFLLMLNSPKPEIIFDPNHTAIGIKNKQNKLELYANKLPEFNRIYLANWFGMKDAIALPLSTNLFETANGQKVVINTNENNAKVCELADIYINMSDANTCSGSKITINKDFLDTNGTVLIFCDVSKCQVKGNYNQRFEFR